MIPWATIPVFTIIAKTLTEHLLARKCCPTRIRKIVESICFALQNIALFIMCQTNNFPVALICMSIITGKSIYMYILR